MAKKKPKPRSSPSSSSKKNHGKHRSVPTQEISVFQIAEPVVISGATVEIPRSTIASQELTSKPSVSDSVLSNSTLALDVAPAIPVLKATSIARIEPEVVANTVETSDLRSHPTTTPMSTLVAPSSGKQNPAAPVSTQPPSPAQASWKSIVKGSPKQLKKKGTAFTLDSGEVCVKIPNAVIERNKKAWECFVLGQFYSDPPSQGTIHNIVNGIWSKQMRDIVVSKMEGNAFLFRIPNTSTRKRVINQRLWQIEGQTMFVADWEPGVTPAKPELTSSPIWLELRNVPLQFFNEEGLEHIAGLVGEPDALHPSTANKTNLEVAKVFTFIDPRKPLPEAVNIQFDSGEIRRVNVSSPWMPPVCSHCKDIWHNLRHCRKAPITCKGCNSTTHSSEACPKANKSGAKRQRSPRRRRSKTPAGKPLATESATDKWDGGLEWTVKRSSEVSQTQATNTNSGSALVRTVDSSLGNPHNQWPGEGSGDGSIILPDRLIPDKQDNISDGTSEAQSDSDDEVDDYLESSEGEEEAILAKLSKKQQKQQRGKSLKPSA
ncbi:hypothetical protein AALP_AA6G212400 [Arabis alpina]|uniref:DUF4283 domain-containing protein n=1 Tax=Arabis alpina TaxID=50452 RepID=A0A087GQR2_ARAAL|nr:hypothetical protein AALP_AA6G212400 [Arabis alpina]